MKPIKKYLSIFSLVLISSCFSLFLAEVFVRIFYGLDQQILSYKKEGKSLNADAIIFFVSKATIKRTHYDYIST